MCGYRNIIEKKFFNWTFGGRNVNGYRWPKTDHTTEFSTGKGMKWDTLAYEVHVFIHSALSSVFFSMSFFFFCRSHLSNLLLHIPLQTTNIHLFITIQYNLSLWKEA